MLGRMLFYHCVAFFNQISTAGNLRGKCDLKLEPRPVNFRTADFSNVCPKKKLG